MSKEDKISKLVWPENIQQRAGIYGYDYSNPSLPVRETIDNTIDILLMKRISLDVKVFTDIDNYNLIYDNGNGIPIYSDKDYNHEKSIIVDLLTKINVGSGFETKDSPKDSYSIKLNGCGLKLSSGLSEDFYVIVNLKKKDKETLEKRLRDKYDEKEYFMINMKMGIIKYYDLFTKDEVMNLIENDRVRLKIMEQDLLNKNLGTLVISKISQKFINDSYNVEYDGYPIRLINRFFKNIDYYKDTNINFKMDNRVFEEMTLENLFRTELVESKTLEFSFDIDTKELLPVKFSFIMGYDKSDFTLKNKGSINLNVTNNGQHVDIILKSLGKALHKFDSRIKEKDIVKGLRIFVLCMCLHPGYNSQTKEYIKYIKDNGFKLTDNMIDSIAKKLLDKVIKPNTKYFQEICERINAYNRETELLSKKDFILSHIKYGNANDVTKKSKSSEMSRVYDSTSKNIDDRELFITEGMSAASLILEIRDIRYHSVLPLKGVTLNVSNVSLEKMLVNKEYLALYNTIGAGIDPYFKLDRMRYGKIIILTDPDLAGNYISGLILGFLGKYMLPAIKSGRVFKVDVPLYIQNGKYIYDEKLLDKKKPFYRNKGIGSFNANEIKDIALDKESRRLIKVTEKDINKANELLSSPNARRRLSKELGILVDKDDLTKDFYDELDEFRKSLMEVSDVEDNEDEFEDETETKVEE